MKARQLVDFIERSRDHVFEITSHVDHDVEVLRHQGDRQLIRLRCSCRWDARLILSHTEAQTAQSVQDAIVIWSRERRLQHLLDQDVPASMILELLKQ